MLTIDEGSDLAEYLDLVITERALFGERVSYAIERTLQWHFGHGHVAQAIGCGYDNERCGLGCDPVLRAVGRWLRERYGDG